MLLLTRKIKANGKVYENGSRQTISAIDREPMRFESGIELKLDDGRFRQGDAVTTYKSQGASKTKMIRVEDNRSLFTMANRGPARRIYPAPRLCSDVLLVKSKRKSLQAEKALGAFKKWARGAP